jgi:hypothetical protein
MGRGGGTGPLADRSPAIHKQPAPHRARRDLAGGEGSAPRCRSRDGGGLCRECRPIARPDGPRSHQPRHQPRAGRRCHTRRLSFWSGVCLKPQVGGLDLRPGRNIGGDGAEDELRGFEDGVVCNAISLSPRCGTSTALISPRDAEVSPKPDAPLLGGMIAGIRPVTVPISALGAVVTMTNASASSPSRFGTSSHTTAFPRGSPSPRQTFNLPKQCCKRLILLALWCEIERRYKIGRRQRVEIGDQRQVFE